MVKVGHIMSNLSWTATILLALLLLTVSSSASPYDADSEVVVWEDAHRFRSQVAESDSVWMIHFYSPNDDDKDSSSKSLELDLAQAAQITKGIFHFGAVDLDTPAGQEIAKEYEIRTSSLPVLYFFTDAKKPPKKYTGKRTLQEILNKIVQLGLDTIQARAGGTGSTDGGHSSSSSSSSSSSRSDTSSKVVLLNSYNFQKEVLDNPMVSAVAFIAPWCGHCKQLLPDWEEAAKRLDGEGAFLGWVDATAEEQLAAMYKVQGYPTIKVFPGGAGKTYRDAKDYQGGRTTADIVQALLAEVDRTGVPKPIPELTSQSVLEEHCSGQNHICVIAGLPHILDSGAETRKAYQETFAKVSKTFRGSAFSFLWFEGTSQPVLEQALEMTFGFPAVAAFSVDKEAFVVMRNSFSEKNVATFLHGVTSGRQRTAKISFMPKVTTVEPWDGTDATPIEEEIPLCEVMGTCDDEAEGEL